MEFVDYLKNKLINANGRSSLIFKNILASFFIKGWSVLVQLMLVPTTLACLGVYENGVWLTISSVLLWIDNLDIGFAISWRWQWLIMIMRKDGSMFRPLLPCWQSLLFRHHYCWLCLSCSLIYISYLMLINV